jgi:hypothetical protein
MKHHITLFVVGQNWTKMPCAITGFKVSVLDIICSLWRNHVYFELISCITKFKRKPKVINLNKLNIMVEAIHHTLSNSVGYEVFPLEISIVRPVSFTNMVDPRPLFILYIFFLEMLTYGNRQFNVIWACCIIIRPFWNFRCINWNTDISTFVQV